MLVGRSAAIGFPPVLQPPVLIRAIPGPGGVTYAPPVPFGYAETVTDIVLFDVEPDGDADLLLGTVGLGGVAAAPRLFVNLGGGSFVEAPVLTGAVAAAVAVGDLNGDGQQDLVLGAATWLRSAGGVAPYSTHAAPLGSIALADLDEDGDLDLFDSAGRWYRGDGRGAFGAPTSIVPTAPVAAIPASPGPVPTDLDADGDLDLVLAAGGGGRFAIYRNLTRHAGPTSLVTQGTTASLAVFGAPGLPWLLGASLPGSLPSALPPFGTLFLDPASLAVIAVGIVPSGGRSDLTVAVPSGPGVAGLALSWQALVGSRLANAFDTAILP